MRLKSVAIIIILALLGSVGLSSPAIAQQNPTTNEQETLKELAKDLAELNAIMQELQRLYQQMTPEEQIEFQKKWIELWTEFQKNPDLKIQRKKP